jgi:hypothetical protein
MRIFQNYVLKMGDSGTENKKGPYRALIHFSNSSIHRTSLVLLTMP